MSCNGDSSCLSSSYAPSVIAAPSGVTVAFSPAAITPPGISEITVTFDRTVNPGPVSITFGFTRVSGSGATPGSATVPFQSLCAINFGTCPQLQIVDAFMTNSPVVSGSPPPVEQTVIGKKAKYVVSQVSGSGSGSYGTPTKISWTIRGSVFARYKKVGAAPTTLTTADLTSATPTPFYWVDSGDHTTSVQATVTRTDNQEIADLVAEADYNVNTPDASVSVTSLGASAVRVGPRSDYPGTYLTFGDQATPSMS